MLQWTVFIYVFAIIDGQPLYDNADVRDMCNVYQQEIYCKLTNMYQHAFFISQILLLEIMIMH